jgi:uncharacterized OB-fold protein
MTSIKRTKTSAGTRRKKPDLGPDKKRGKTKDRGLPAKCPSCGKPVGSPSKVCPACGAILDPAAIRDA